MQMESYLCLNELEISNHYRTSSYVTNSGIPTVTMNTICACEVLDEGFDLPATDPAPWYEDTRPESADFLGLWAHEARLESVLSRASESNSYVGSTISTQTARGRVVTVNGIMVASSQAGMAYGERWLTEALRPVGDLKVLPACPEDGYPTGSFRILGNTALIDGPLYVPLANDVPECYAQTAAFSLVSPVPWILHEPDRCLDDVSVGSGVNCALTTPEWMGSGTFYIKVRAQTAISGLRIEGKVSLDGSCPVASPGNSVMPCFVYEVGSIRQDDYIVIDGARRQAHYFDASCKQADSLLPHTTFNGPWAWPDVGPCTTVCLTITRTSGTARATVDTYLREL